MCVSLPQRFRKQERMAKTSPDTVNFCEYSNTEFQRVVVFTGRDNISRQTMRTRHSAHITFTLLRNLCTALQYFILYFHTRNKNSTTRLYNGTNFRPRKRCHFSQHFPGAVQKVSAITVRAETWANVQFPVSSVAASIDAAGHRRTPTPTLPASAAFHSSLHISLHISLARCNACKRSFFAARRNDNSDSLTRAKQQHGSVLLTTMHACNRLN